MEKDGDLEAVFSLELSWGEEGMSLSINTRK